MNNKNLIEILPCISCILTKDDEIYSVNKSFCDFFNNSQDSFIGINFKSFLQKDSELKKDNIFSNTNNTETIIFDNQHIVDSEVKWVEWNVKKIDSDVNEEKHFIAFGWNITDRKLKEEHLKREQFFFNLLMDNITDQIYFKDAQSRFLKISRTFAKRQNFNSPEEVIGKTDFDLFTREHAQQAFDDEMEIIKSGKLLQNIEEQETWFDGKITWVSSTKLPYLNDKGDVIGTFGISRDITSRKLVQESLKKSEEQLRNLNAVKDKFFSIVAHDLRSPFNGLFGLVNIILSEINQISKDKIQEYLTLLNGQMKQVFQLLEDLLEWGRIQRNAIEYLPEPSNICQTINNIVDLYAINAKNKNIVIRLNIPDEIIVCCDIKMISTVLRNLLINAIKFTNPGGSIEIGATANITEVKVSVKDTGVGISRNNLQRLFNLTEYFSTKGTSQEKGTGLGLILCKEFVEKHGGKISVDTEINKGSNFYFTIPK
jgi:two-component system, sensor histidine kinase and response regulator